MKKFISTLVIFVLCICFCACAGISTNESSDISDSSSAVKSNHNSNSISGSSSNCTTQCTTQSTVQSSTQSTSQTSAQSTSQSSSDSNSVKTISSSVISVGKGAFTIVYNGITYKIIYSGTVEVQVGYYATVEYSGTPEKIDEKNYKIIATKVTAFPPEAKKPVIYLYPTEKTEVNVGLDFNGSLTCTYPEYNDGWDVTAYPDGRIINKADGREYSYLYWEGDSYAEYDFTKGFVVKGTDTASFLQEKLANLGLTPKEYNEFIVYWLPQMQNNKYNLITFQGKAYTDNAVLNITPKPDSILRVFMAYKPLDEYKEIEEQKLQPFERKGFAVVEWGGTCID